jgi:FMN phosphatase YigB (HAD superfamily)
MSDNEFNVVEFYDDDYHTTIDRWMDAKSAVELAARLVKLEQKHVNRIIITDGGDNTVFQWEQGKGVTFPEQREP